ncbi:MAG: hypothetical protein ACQEQR_03665 [Pseudomonadota bacterium]
MTGDKNIYGEIDNKTNLQDVFLNIRKDVEQADSRAALTELYRRAGYLITLSYANSWQKKFGNEIDEIRSTAEDEFATTARKINRRARDIGTDDDYDEAWGDMKND